MNDDEFRLLVVRQLEAIRRWQTEAQAQWDFLRRTLWTVIVMVVLLAIGVAVLAIIPGVQLGEL